jgi:probable HAF family extracellular repeat protein
MHRALLSTVLSLSVLLSPLVAAYAASYTFTTIDVPGATNTEAYGINTADQIVGIFYDATGRLHGFLKDGATFTTIDVPGATQTEARGISETGEIVGFFYDATGGGRHGFVTDGATFTPIDVPGAFLTAAYGINTADQIVGTFQDATERYHGFVTDGATFIPIDVPGAFLTAAYGINTADQIVGTFRSASGPLHGFVATPDEGDTTPPVITVVAAQRETGPRHRIRDDYRWDQRLRGAGQHVSGDRRVWPDPAERQRSPRKRRV